ncbi:hypothetical protein [Flavobacterium sp.]|uniref:hypothetical protein n=1 Tax=Flavobacterium sp. TaxID=239 RepID=UPI00404849FC
MVLSDGLGNTIAGGDFWSGVRQGIITSGLNHLAHEGINKLEIRRTLLSRFKKVNGKHVTNPYAKPEFNPEGFKALLDNVDGLQSTYDKGNRPEIDCDYNSAVGEYVSGDHKVYINKAENQTNYKLASTFFHEFRHAI